MAVTEVQAAYWSAWNQCESWFLINHHLIMRLGKKWDPATLQLLQQRTIRVFNIGSWIWNHENHDFIIRLGKKVRSKKKNDLL